MSRAAEAKLPVVRPLDRRSARRRAAWRRRGQVLAFMSQNHIDPDLAVEVFVLQPDGAD